MERWRGRIDTFVDVTVDRAPGSWRGNVGVVTDLVDRARFDPGQTLAMVCGPEIMMRHTVQALGVSGVPDERMGEVARAYIVTTSSAELDEAAVIAWSRDNMANYKVPRSVRFVQEFPLNASGKVLKNELREMARREMA